MHVLLCPDKFKGSLTAVQVAAHLAAGLRSVVPHIPLVEVPIADGGDGTVDAAVTAGFRRVPVTVTGPTGEPVTTSYARQGSRAVVELASAAGLSLLAPGALDPLGASSEGFGEVIAAALDAGCRTVVLGIGGSASTDGGAGMLQALGFALRDPAGRRIAPGGRGLAGVATLDRSGCHPGLASASFVVACDVDNPLIGPTGAAAVYGPQKGATAADVLFLDSALQGWADVVAGVTGRDVSGAAGAGAAGGVGFAAVALLGARLVPGIELMLDLVGFRAHLAGCRLVITGEGALDEQTLAGKAPAGVAAAARRVGLTTLAVTGHNDLTPAQLRAAGISGAYALTDLEPDVARCMAGAGPLLERAAAALAHDWL